MKIQYELVVRVRAHFDANALQRIVALEAECNVESDEEFPSSRVEIIRQRRIS